MSVYLTDIPLEQAWQRWIQALNEAGINGVLGSELIPLDENAVGRILAEPVWAKISSPHYHSAAMDGFAIRSSDTASALPSRSVRLNIKTQAVYVDTGDPLPEFANAVIPIEQVDSFEESGSKASNIREPKYIEIRASVPPWSFVRLMGEDIVATQLVLSAGNAIRPVDLGAMAACGHTQILVSRKPRVAIIPTGTELIPVGEEVRVGSIIEFNSIVLAGQINLWGGDASRFSVQEDNFEKIKSQVWSVAQNHDLILINAGSSAGSEDYSSTVIESLGQLLVHGIAIRPGHPVILGMIQVTETRKVPIIGVPGYPVSAAMTGEILIQPTLAIWTGQKMPIVDSISARLTHKINSPPGDDDYIRMVAGKVGGVMVAAPLPRGAGVINSLVKADGITILPRGTQGLEAGSQVTVRLYRHPTELEKTLFLSGSHDLTLDVLADELFQKGVRLVSTNVGSLGGLVALRRGEAHAAGSHLLDPETGEYNLSYIRQYLDGRKVAVVHWAERLQGLIVQKGNPKNIQSLPDISGQRVDFVNRQRGAGTRVLLDYHLKKLGIGSDTISGYDQEEYTHLAVAAAVSSNRADCGLGIASAANALDLDFIPLYNETYELIIPEDYLADPLLLTLLDTAQSPVFQKRLSILPGYSISKMGKIRIIL